MIANRTEVSLKNAEKMFESRISARAIDKLPAWEESHANTIASTESTWTPKIQIKYVDTKNQLADMLTFSVCSTSRTFHILHLATSAQFTTSNHVERAETARKTRRKPGENERVVETSKPMRNLVSKTVHKSPTALSSSAFYSLGTRKAKSPHLDLTSTEKFVSRDSSENTASSVRARRSDVNLSSRAGKPAAETAKNPIGTRFSHHNMTISRIFVGHLEKVYSNVRQKLGRQPGDDMPEIDVNMMIWRIFTSATKKAAVHLGQDYQDSVRTTKNADFEKIEQ